jgi:hypothetical protein
LKFDTPRFPNATSAADVIGSKIFYALGYNTPENYVARFPREQLTLDPEATISDITGYTRRMTDYDIDKLLLTVHRAADGKFRALASLYVEGELLGPWLYHGTRSDDPNDIYPHEHRRDLRGLYVFAAWLNHYDATSLNTLDTVVEENGRRFVRHYLIDFGSMLGSSGIGARDPRNGYVFQHDFDFALKQLLTLGISAPAWQRARYPDLPEAGRLESEAFDPFDWKPIYPNPAFENRLPDDTFWAAKQVMTFTDEEIRELVRTGEYEDERAVDWLTRTLIARRDKIGRAFFSTVLPLDEFRVSGGSLIFEDLAARFGFAEPVPLVPSWFLYDNVQAKKTPVAGGGFTIPAACEASAAGGICGVTIRGPRGQRVESYLRKRSGGDWVVVGLHRNWSEEPRSAAKGPVPAKGLQEKAATAASAQSLIIK